MAAVIAALRRKKKRGTRADAGADKRMQYRQDKTFSVTNMTVGMLVARFCAKLKSRIRITDSNINWDGLRQLQDRSDGLKRMFFYIAFLIVFYGVLWLQRDNIVVFEVTDIVKSSLHGTEWSHDNTLMEANNLGGMPQPDLMQNFWGLITEVTKELHSEPDPYRGTVEARQEWSKMLNKDAQRMGGPDTKNQPPWNVNRTDAATLVDIEGNWGAFMDKLQTNKKLASTSWGTLSAAEKKDVKGMLAQSVAHTSRFDTPEMAAALPACHALSPLRAGGLSTYLAGVDHLPNLPFYKTLDRSAGHLYGQNRFLGKLQVRRFDVEGCVDGMDMNVRESEGGRGGGGGELRMCARRFVCVCVWGARSTLIERIVFSSRI
jgi:hypothetical protein